jgi:hypothetical protein
MRQDLRRESSSRLLTDRRCQFQGDKWGATAYSVETILFVFAGYTKNANFVFTPSTREAFAGELSRFRTGKGSVQLPTPTLCRLNCSAA